MKKTVVFVHGNSLSSETFKAQLSSPELATLADLRAFDLPGHGFGPRLERYSLNSLIDSLHDHIISLDVRKVILVGHSLGGHVCINLLTRSLSFEIEGLFLFGTPPLKKPLDMEAFLPDPNVGLIFQEKLAPDEVQRLAIFLGDQSFAKLIDQSDPLVRKGLSEAVQNGEVADEVGLLKAFDKPIALIHSSDDKAVNLAYIEALQLPLWRGGVQLISNGGHSPQYSVPEIFNTLLISFLQAQNH